MKATRIYFAYGSNLWPARLRARTPSACILGPAVLPRNRLAWHKHGADDSGKCDIVFTGNERHEVHGALYEIDIADWHHLDVAEELGTGYGAETVHVSANGRRVEAHTYRALVTDPQLKPFDWYKSLVIHGARAHGLPAGYVARLEQASHWPDPDAGRVRLNRRLLDAPASPD